VFRGFRTELDEGCGQVWITWRPRLGWFGVAVDDWFFDTQAGMCPKPQKQMVETGFTRYSQGNRLINS
jgi:hypothetical protein